MSQNYHRYRQQTRVRRRRRHRFLTGCGLALLLLIVLLVWLLSPSQASPEDHVNSSITSRFRSLLSGENPYSLLEEDWVTQDLLPVNEYSRPGTKLSNINGIVVHYVGNPGTTAQQNRNYFASLADTHAASASSHFVIGLNGEVLQCIPMNEVAYCSNDRNNDTLSIECCHPGEDGAFNEETYTSLIRLLRTLCDLYDLNSGDILRHYDVTGKECPLYYVEHEDAWEQLKTDVFDPNFPLD